MGSKSNITRRGDVWYFVMRVPSDYAAVDYRDFVKFSLKTEDRAEAQQRASEARARLLSLWKARAAGIAGDGLAEFEALVQHCRNLGFTYKPLSDLSDDDLVSRLNEIGAGAPKETAIAALGVVPSPASRVGSMFDIYAEAKEDAILGKSDHQMRVWKNPFLRAQEALCDLVGNIPIDDLSRADGLALRAAMLDRVKAGEIKANSANRVIGSLSSMWNVYAKRAQITAPNPFSALSITEGRKEHRQPVPEEYIRMLLKPGVLDRLNPSCRGILLAGINTGCRPSEIIGLQPQHIRIDANIPHIQIRPVGRDLKTSSSERDIPLVGVSLEAMRANPDGFPDYAHAPTNATANTNKFLRLNNLVPEREDQPGKYLTSYCFRHSFQDRLTAAEVPERIARDLMGHRLKGERYGDGASLEHKARILAPISH